MTQSIAQAKRIIGERVKYSRAIAISTAARITKKRNSAARTATEREM